LGRGIDISVPSTPNFLGPVPPVPPLSTPMNGSGFPPVFGYQLHADRFARSKCLHFFLMVCYPYMYCNCSICSLQLNNKHWCCLVLILASVGKAQIHSRRFSNSANWIVMQIAHQWHHVNCFQ